MGISSLLNMGKDALLANQAAIQTTGNNLANVNTVGYSRQVVRFEARTALNGRGGQFGQGAYAAEVMRYFDKFVEGAYLPKNSAFARYDNLQGQLRNVENLFNETTGSGINGSMSKFFGDWQRLSQRPDDPAMREALLTSADTLAALIRNADQSLKTMQQSVDKQIQGDITAANSLMERIAGLNKQLKIYDEPGVNNANQILDQRDALVRELSTIIDIEVQDRMSGDYVILTAGGYPLVEGSTSYELSFEGPNTEQYLKRPASTFDGNIGFMGSSTSEYTLEFVTAGATGVAEYKVSLDGGNTWLRDDSGNIITYTADTIANRETVGELEIYFDNNAPGNFAVGDRFSVVPKSAVYWNSSTRGKELISTVINGDGTDKDRRIEGGSLAGYISFRDQYVGEYRKKLNETAQALIWEVNNLHGQGTGLDKLTQVASSYGVNLGFEGAPLANTSTGQPWRDRLSEGSFSIYSHDIVAGTTTQHSIDFTGLGVPPSATPNFNPEVHSLNDVRDAINASAPHVTATVANGKLEIQSAAGFEMGFGNDTSGLLASMGINNFFTGTGAHDIAMNADIVKNSNLLAAASMDGAFEGNVGDNITARDIAALMDKKIGIKDAFGRTSNLTITESYGIITAKIGAETQAAKFSADYNKALARDLDAQQAAASGVNLDEEMASLVKFQHSYTAAAKLITTADQMLQTLLGLKQ